jgi:hypothetical protein
MYRFPMMLAFEAASVGRSTALGPLRQVHVSFRSGRLTGSNVATWVLSSKSIRLILRFRSRRTPLHTPDEVTVVSAMTAAQITDIAAGRKEASPFVIGNSAKHPPCSLCDAQA